MFFIVQFEDVYPDHPERLLERAQYMEGHLAFLAKHGDLIVAAGALRPTASGTPTGGIWILNIDSAEAAEAQYQDDPFWRAGLRKSVRVSHWAKAYWSPELTNCAAAIGIA